MSDDPPTDLASLLVRTRKPLLAFVSRNARGLLRYETVEDIVQAIHLKALEKEDSFAYRGDDPFFSWLFTVARNHMRDRSAHWRALKRRSGRLLRYTAGAGGTSDPGAVPEPAGSRTGPSTFAARREQILMAVRALDLLLPRDRDLVRWSAEGLTLQDQADRLGLNYKAVERARNRAVERFRGAFQLVTKR